MTLRNYSFQEIPAPAVSYFLGIVITVLCCKVKTIATQSSDRGHRTTKRSKGGKTYEVVVGVMEWCDDGCHCFCTIKPASDRATQ